MAGDGARVAEMLVESAPQHWCETFDEFKEDMRRLVNKFIGELIRSHRIHTRYLSAVSDGSSSLVKVAPVLQLKELHIAQLMSELLTVVSTHKVCLRPNFTSTLLALMVLEGFGRSLDPDINLIAAARPFLFRAL